MQRKTPLILGEYYHIYSRGVDKKEIYLDDSDYFRFMLLLYLCNSTKNIHLSKIFRDLKGQRDKSQGASLTRNKLLELFEIPTKDRLVSICAYCLMPNHFHLVIKEIREGGITTFMKKLQTAYSMHFNKKYKRSGALLSRPFRSKHINEENYFQYIFSYIHLNPVKIIDSKWKENGIKDLVKTKKYLNEYKYSSYMDFLKKERPEKKILSIEDIPDYFDELDELMEFETIVGLLDKSRRVLD